MFYILYDCNINFNYSDLVPGSAEEEWLDSQNSNSPFKPLFDEARQKVKKYHSRTSKRYFKVNWIY